MGRNNIDMTKGPLFSKIIVYTVPVMLTSLLQLMFNAADLMVVGRYSNSLSVGGVGATSQITALIVTFFLGLSMGCGVTVAHAIGAGDSDRVRKTVHTAIPVAAISGAVLTVIGVTFSGMFLEWMGTPSDIIGLSTTYMRIYFGGVIFNLVYNFGASILRAVGDSKRPLYYLTISGVTNFLLNLVFVIYFKLDVAGVALATTISQALSAVLVLTALSRRTDDCRLSFKHLKIDRKSLEYICRIGIPSGLQSSLFAISNVLIQSSVNSFEAAAVTGSAAAHNIEMFVYSAMNSFSQAGLNFVGQNMGAKNYKRVDKTALYVVLSSFVFALVAGPLVHHFGGDLIKLYLNTEKSTEAELAEIIGFGVTRMAYVCRLYALCTLGDMLTSIMRGMGKSSVPMIISILGACVFRIAWIYTAFAHTHTPEMLFVSYPISWILVFTADLTAFFILRKKLYKKAVL